MFICLGGTSTEDGSCERKIETICQMMNAVTSNHHYSNICTSIRKLSDKHHFYQHSATSVNYWHWLNHIRRSSLHLKYFRTAAIFLRSDRIIIIIGKTLTIESLDRWQISCLWISWEWSPISYCIMLTTKEALAIELEKEQESDKECQRYSISTNLIRFRWHIWVKFELPCTFNDKCRPQVIKHMDIDNR